MRFHESFITGPDGTSLFMREAEVPNARANVLLVHGLGEHSGRYRHVAEFLGRHGYRFWSVDLRGHGRSAGRRGDILRYDQLLDDLHTAVSRLGESLPLFLYGHSLGGQLVLNFAIRRAFSIGGAIAASPWLDLVFQPQALQLALAKIALKLCPGFTQRTKLDPRHISRDQEFLRMLWDELIHDRISARMYAELVAAAAFARSNAARFDLPLLLIHGEADPVTCPRATETFFKKAASSDKTLRLYPGLLHETHNELERETVLGNVVAWLNERSGSSA